MGNDCKHQMELQQLEEKIKMLQARIDTIETGRHGTHPPDSSSAQYYRDNRLEWEPESPPPGFNYSSSAQYYRENRLEWEPESPN